MNRWICAKLVCLFVFILFLGACGANVGYRKRTVPLSSHGHFYIELRQDGRQNGRVLAISLQREAVWQCENLWYRGAWIRALRVWFASNTYETVGGAVFYCYGNQERLKL